MRPCSPAVEPFVERKRICVIVPTLGRPEVVARLLDHLGEQKRLPDHVLISTPDVAHLPDLSAYAYPVSFVTGGRGLAIQRNLGLELAIPQSEIITFFDDDFLPASDYLANVERCFIEQPDIAAVMGHALVDGARGPGLSFEEGTAILRAAQTRAREEDAFVDQPGAYGCNMSIRTASIGDIRFDERLVLYGWQEDIDFTGQIRRRGRIAKMTPLYGVHLGIKSGKVSGLKFGYSQLVNPVYLIRKGTIPTRFALNLMARNVIANVVRSFWSEPYIDRAGRLRGNLIAACHLARGRVDPEYVLKLP